MSVRQKNADIKTIEQTVQELYRLGLKDNIRNVIFCYQKLLWSDPDIENRNKLSF